MSQMPNSCLSHETSSRLSETVFAVINHWNKKHADSLSLKQCCNVADRCDAPKHLRLHPRGRPPGLLPAAPLGHGPSPGGVWAAPALRDRWVFGSSMGLNKTWSSSCKHEDVS